MNLREYQGRELFARYGLPVLPGSDGPVRDLLIVHYNFTESGTAPRK